MALSEQNFDVTNYFSDISTMAFSKCTKFFNNCLIELSLITTKSRAKLQVILSEIHRIISIMKTKQKLIDDVHPGRAEPTSPMQACSASDCSTLSIQVLFPLGEILCLACSQAISKMNSKLARTYLHKPSSFTTRSLHIWAKKWSQTLDVSWYIIIMEKNQPVTVSQSIGQQ